MATYAIAQATHIDRLAPGCRPPNQVAVEIEKVGTRTQGLDPDGMWELPPVFGGP